MEKLSNTQKMFVLNGVTFTQTKTGYCFKTTGLKDKKGQDISRRISKSAFDAAYEDYLNASAEWEQEVTARLEEVKKAIEAEDRNTEEQFNGTAEKEIEQEEEPVVEKKTAKPRRSKDIAYEGNGVTLTAKQVDFIHHIPDTCFYEHGLDSTPWCDVLTDEIGGQFANKPMTVGAMISTLREKNLIYVGTEKVNGKKAKFFGFTDLGKKVASDLGLE